jgi:hypothetical protein
MGVLGGRTTGVRFCTENGLFDAALVQDSALEVEIKPLCAIFGQKRVFVPNHHRPQTLVDRRLFLFYEKVGKNRIHNLVRVPAVELETKHVFLVLALVAAGFSYVATELFF